MLQGGVGSAILELLAEKNITGVEVKRLGLSDEFVNHASQAEQRDKYALNEKGISRVIREMIASGTFVKN